MNIVIHPEYYALQEEIKKLRENLSQLFLRRDELVCHVCPNVQADYMLKVGAFEYKLYELDCMTARLRRKLELLRAALNRQESVDLTWIEQQLDIEFDAYNQELLRRMKDLDDALKQNEKDFLSEKDSVELKKLYRLLIKRLHPDVCHDRTEEQSRLFEHACAAYKNGDLATMRTIAMLLEKDIDFDEKYSPLDLEKLRADVDILRKRCDKIAYEIKEIENSFPYDQIEFLRDDDRVAAYVREINEQIEVRKEVCSCYEQMIREIMTGSTK